jgi:site-specific DNA-methyltransferase (adenine-specific)
MPGLPKPYYEDDYATIYHGDCLDILPLLSGVDLVFTSPPYNKGDTGGREWKRLDAGGYGTHTDRMADADYVQWQHTVVSDCMATLSENGCLMYQHKPMAKGGVFLDPQRLIPARFPIRQIVTWDRGSGFQRDGRHLCPEYEWVLVVANEEWRVADRSIGDVWRISAASDGEHPASFPVALPQRAIVASDPCLVLDPFAGSGTTLRAAKDLGRKSIGIEISEEYCEIAANRLGQEVLPFEGLRQW